MKGIDIFHFWVRWYLCKVIGKQDAIELKKKSNENNNEGTFTVRRDQGYRRPREKKRRYKGLILDLQTSNKFIREIGWR